MTSVSTPKDQAREDERVEKQSLSNSDRLRVATSYHREKLPPGFAQELFDFADEWDDELEAVSVSPSPADPVRAALEEILQTLNDQATPAPWYHRQAGATGNNTPLDWIGDAPDGQPHSKIILGRQCLYGGSSDYAFVAAAVLYVRNYVVPAALATLSNPPGRQEEDEGLRRACVPDVPASDHCDYLGEVVAQYVTNAGVLADVGGAIDAIRAALVHPPQEGGRDRERFAQVIHDHTHKSQGLVEWSEIIKYPRYREGYAAKKAYGLADKLLAAPTPSPAVPGSGEGK